MGMDINYTALSGAILAGGKSTRLGKDKALLLLQGRTFMDHLITAIGCVVEEVVIVADDAQRYISFNVPVVPDVFSNSGPLGGIHSALVHSQASAVFVVSCDQPLLTPEIIREVVSLAGPEPATVLGDVGRSHTLIGLFKKECLPILERLLQLRKRKFREFLHESGARLVSPQEIRSSDFSRLLVNVNTAEDYAALLHLFPSP